MAPPKPRVFTIQCKSLMTKSGIPSVDYAVNPYLGCEHGCVYCYATFMSRFGGIKDPWGSFVGVKENAPEVLRREIPLGAPGVVTFGTVCDAYQPVEEEYRVTRSCLEAFVGADGFEVGVLTKSDLVERDIDVLSRIESADVGFSITTLDREVASIFEPSAPSPSRRLATMRRLSESGVEVWGFFGPILPAFSDGDEQISETLLAMSRSGARRVLVDTLNLYPRVRGSVRTLVAQAFPERLPALESILSDHRAYTADLRERVEDASRTVGVEADVCF